MVGAISRMNREYRSTKEAANGHVSGMQRIAQQVRLVVNDIMVADLEDLVAAFLARRSLGDQALDAHILAETSIRNAAVQAHVAVVILALVQVESVK